MKQPTPNKIALHASLAIAGGLSVFLSILAYIGVLQVHWYWIFLFFIVALASAYGISTYYLGKYIFKKISVIYRIIHNRKLDIEEKTESININSDIIGKVEKEVQEWSANRDKELESLRTYEEYRRKFVGDISHELKTPIFNIQGYLDTLLEGAINDKKVRRKFLSRAAKNSERLATIVEDLEAITRLESGKLMLDFQIFNIKDLVQECFDDLEMKIDEQNFSLEFNAKAFKGYRVKADKETIRQVLMNLLVNSIKYGSKGGHTKVGFYEMDNRILIEIADNGLGIDEKHLPRLFDRFYRVDKSRSREQGGSGLGLSIVKHIIEAHQQTINVRSTLGVGTTFGFTLEKA